MVAVYLSFLFLSQQHYFPVHRSFLCVCILVVFQYRYALSWEYVGSLGTLVFSFLLLQCPRVGFCVKQCLKGIISFRCFLFHFTLYYFYIIFCLLTSLNGFNPSTSSDFENQDLFCILSLSKRAQVRRLRLTHFFPHSQSGHNSLNLAKFLSFSKLCKFSPATTRCVH